MAIPDLLAAGAAAGLIFLISFTLTHITNILARLREEARDVTGKKIKFPYMPLVGAVLCALLAVFQSISVPAASKQ